MGEVIQMRRGFKKVGWLTSHPVTERTIDLVHDSKLSLAEIAEAANGQITVGTLKRWRRRMVYRPQWVTLRAVWRVLAAHGQERAVVELMFEELGIEK